jgi:PDZ domain
LVDTINGLRIEKMADVVRAFESSTNAFDVINFVRTHQFECLDHAEAVKANAEILKTYGVLKDRHL